MLNVFLTYTDKKREELNGLLSLSLSMELDVPADSLTLTVPYADRLAGADYITVQEDGETVFYGQTDEIAAFLTAQSRVTRITARSLAGALLDNEAEPLMYTNPSSALMFERHLRPFGVEVYDTERHPYYGTLRIDKGMSHWQVLANFCMNRYGSVPRIEGRRAYLKGYFPEGEVAFGEKGIVCTEAREYRRRHKLISAVRLRLNRENGYNAGMVNPDRDAAFIRRVRYVNAVSGSATPETARRLLRASCRAAYQLRLRCPGLHVQTLGKRASFEGRTGLRVSGVRFSLSEQGAYTDVTLRKDDA